MIVSRKQIANALLAQLNQSGVFPTLGRRLIDVGRLATEQFPALFLIKPNEDYSYDGEGRSVPPTRVLEFLAVIYTNYSEVTAAIPADNIDDLLDAIDVAIAPSARDHMVNGGRSTLGDLVYSCVIMGRPELAPGDDVGRGETVVPIHIVIRDYP